MGDRGFSARRSAARAAASPGLSQRIVFVRLRTFMNSFGEEWGGHPRVFRSQSERGGGSGGIA
jgi:hypothetical protein